MKLANIVITAAILVAAAFPVTASATTINFGDLERGTVVSNQFPGVSFSLNGGPGEDGSPLAGWAFGGEEGQTVELLNSTTEDYPTSAFLNIIFSAPANNVSFRFNNYGFPEEFCCEGARTIAPLALGRGFSFWTSYDIGGNILDSEELGFTDPYELIIVGSGVKTLVISNGVFDPNDQTEDQSWLFGVSQLNFDGAVPEPGTWAMMILGFGAIGSAMRRRQAALTA